VRGPDEKIEIIEGNTRLFVPTRHSVKGPGKREKVFYNRQMAFSRDISILFFRATRFNGEAVDCMAGTGARGVRITNEVEDGVEMTVNDASPLAYRYIEENILLNELDRCQPSCRDLHCLLSERKFDYVDIDPFGTPVPFLQSAIRGLRNRGMLAVTATDTAPLFGTYPRVCERRYGATSGRCDFGHEVGLRILIGYVAREAAKFDRGVEPIFCFYADHYFRLHLSMVDGAGRVEQALDELIFIMYDPITGKRDLLDRWESGAFGPLWGGPLKNRETVLRMEPDVQLAEFNRVRRFLPIYAEEMESPYFYETAELSHLLGGSPPRMREIIEALKEAGEATRTHFSPTGFKTDLEFEEIKQILLRLMKK